MKTKDRHIETQRHRKEKKREKEYLPVLYMAIHITYIYNKYSEYIIFKNNKHF